MFPRLRRPGEAQAEERERHFAEEEVGKEQAELQQQERPEDAENVALDHVDTTRSRRPRRRHVTFFADRENLPADETGDSAPANGGE
jgi:hypothetical protein